MSAKYLNNKGIGSTVIIAAVAVVIVVVAAGVAVYKHNDNSTIKAETATTSDTKTQQPVTDTTQPAQTAKQYLAIKEWGVQIPLADAIKDAYYTTKTSGTGADGVANTAWVGLTSLNGKGCNIAETGPTTTQSPVASVIRVLPTDRDPVTNKLYTEQTPGGVTVAGYYYAVSPWDNTCAPAATLQTINAAFADSSKTITAAAATR